MKNYLTLIMMLLTLIATATEPVSNAKTTTITGKVIDEETKMSLPYASVSVLSITDSVIVSGGLTDDNGAFKIEKIPQGTYIIEYSFLGYETLYKSNVVLNKSMVNLGTAALSVGLTLSTTTLETTTIENRIDKKVVNVGKDLVTAGATASDIMNNIPSVNVDNEGNISLRGNQNVRVFVDGKPSSMSAADLLKQIPSNSIKKIEIITNPSAKYDADGTSGIINIILKKGSRKGYNGSLNMGWTKANLIKNTSNLDMNYGLKKVNFFTNFGYNNNPGYFGGTITQYQEDSPTVLENSQKLGGNMKTRIPYFKVGMDWYISDRDVFTISTNQSFAKTDMIFDFELLNRNLDTSILQDVDFQDQKNIEYRANYQHDFKKEDQKLTIDAQYLKNTTDNNSTRYYVTNNFQEKQNTDNTSNQLNITMDFETPLAKESKLELGWSARMNTYDNSVVGLLNGIDSYQMDFERNIYAAYVQYQTRIKDKLGVNIGLRAELSDRLVDVDGAQTKKDYTNYYPTIHFKYELPKMAELFLSYSKRVDRPNRGQLSPIDQFNSPTVISIGNANLDPQFTHSYELGYSKRLAKGKGMINTSIFYKNITDEIARFIQKPETTDGEAVQKLLLSYNNVQSNSMYGVELSGMYKLSKKWTIMPSFDVASATIRGFDGDNNPKSVDFINYGVRVNNNITLSKKSNLTVFGMHLGPRFFTQGQSKSMTRLDLGYQYKLMDNKLQLSARLSDIFNTFYARFSSQDPFPNEGQFRWESRSIYIGVVYSFGGGKLKKRRLKDGERDVKQGSGGIGF